MISVPVDVVFFTQAMPVGKPFNGNKSVKADDKTRLTYVGSGVLVEHAGERDRFVPNAQVLFVEASEKITAGEWCGSEDLERKKPGPKPKA